MKQILETLRDHIEAEPEEGFSGMCNSAMRAQVEGKITQAQYFVLRDYLVWAMPPHVEKWGDYWWKEGVKPPRLAWLKNEIKNY